MDIYLGLGSNMGQRRTQLASALAALERHGVEVLRVSPTVESPAMLPDAAPPAWNRPFLNLVAHCRRAGTARRLLDDIHEIERELGRGAEHEHWAPRPIDIDILLCGDERITAPDLTVPHPGLAERNFVLSPLAALAPGLELPGSGGKTVLAACRELPHHIPLWMGIVNVTPDSFSDGGRFLDWSAVEPHVEAMFEAGAQIVDLGAQSTRPGAVPLDADEELDRLLPVLEPLAGKYEPRRPRPWISVDTFHAEVARRALDLGVDIINDVGGLESPEMIELAAGGDADWVAMHNLGLPADRDRTLPADADPVEALERWLSERIESWLAAGLDLDRIIFDPGIGFGKNPLQSLSLLRQIQRFERFGLRCLVGHSRKSFMKAYAGTDDDGLDRDLATVGASLQLCTQQVDILRVHNVAAHVGAYRGWSHVQPV